MSLNRADIIQAFRSRILAGKRNKLSKQEFDALVESLIERLQTAKSSEEIHEICRSEISLLEEGYKKLTLASIYIPRYRAAIKEAIDAKRLKLTPQTSHEYQYQQRVTGKHETRCEHWALTYFKYTPEEYEQLDSRQAEVNQTRLNSLKTVQLDRYLDAIDQLLHSQDKFAARHQAIAIAALTGRRMGEVVAKGKFHLTEHPYQLHFTGQQKYERDGYDILTLIPASQLLDKIAEFRMRPEIRDLLVLEGKELKKQLNKFDVQINKECDKRLHLTHIVPSLEGKKSVTIHNLRSLWGAIAVHFFCPQEQHEYAFLQHYFGHVLKSSATGHYFRYQLIDRDEHLLTQKGIKLHGLSISSTSYESKNENLDDQSLLGMSKGYSDEFIPPSVLQVRWQRNWHQIFLEFELLKQSLESACRECEKLSGENVRLESQNTILTQRIKQAEAKLTKFHQILVEEPRESDLLDFKASDMRERSIKQTRNSKNAKPLTTNKDLAKKKQVGRKPGQAFERARYIFGCIQEWNYQNPDNTFAISPGFLESVFHINRKAAKQFCSKFDARIRQHHQKINVDRTASHNRGKDTTALLKSIANASKSALISKEKIKGGG